MVAVGFSPRIGRGRTPRRAATLEDLPPHSSRVTSSCLYGEHLHSFTTNDIFLPGSLSVEFRRRYATRSSRCLVRGLKPTATIMGSLRDRARPENTSRYSAMNASNSLAEGGTKSERGSPAYSHFSSSGLAKAMGRVTCRTYVQPAGYPVQGHRRFSSQSPGQLRVSFAPGLARP